MTVKVAAGLLPRSIHVMCNGSSSPAIATIGTRTPQRAAGVKGVAFVKHVLEKYGGLELLKTALDHIRICGMQPVLGNGGATDITSWQEACVATHAVDLPCEMHSFLKVKEPLLDEPLPFESGDIVLRPDYRPGVNESILKRYTVSEQRFATPVHSVH